MSSDEQEIRQLVATWFAATKAGDTATVLELMADDVVFLRPGEPPMHKEDFARAAHQQQEGEHPMKIEGSSEIQELRIFASWAYMWTRINVVITSPDKRTSSKRSGDTLSILHKQNGKWLLARDANLLVPVS
jgi:uncharacterized protein (TIGR02246 family)